MGNIIVIAVIVIIAFFAVRSSMKHFKGEGGCCGGGGSDQKVEKKVLTGQKLGEKIIHIDGMHCDNCKNSVERQINKIDGASATVNLRKKIAVVEYDRELDDEDLRKAVERLDFKVTGIESRQQKTTVYG